MDHLAAAQAALNAGRKPEAIDHLKAAIDENPDRPVGAFRILAMQLYQAGRYVEGEAFAAIGARRFPRDFDLLNLYGVLLRRLKRYPEALGVLERAVQVSPKNTGGQNNLGNVMLDLGLAARAEQVFTRLARNDPRNADYQRQLGRALLKQGRTDAGFVRLRSAVALRKDFVDAWLDMIGYMNDQDRGDEADALCLKALETLPDEIRLLEGRVLVMRRAGRQREAAAWLETLLARLPQAAGLHYQLGACVADYDRERANQHLRHAAELAPDNLDYAFGLIESLERTRTGDEGGNIEESYQQAKRFLPRRDEFSPMHVKIAFDVFTRVCAFDEAELIGDFRTYGREMAESGRHTALLKQMPRVKTDEDRLELVEQHLIWGRQVEQKAAARPIQHPAPRPPGGKIRVGFMSSDLRRHPVGYFAQPLFDHYDRNRFEVFVYSYYQGAEDDVQRYITERIAGYRWWPDITARDAAQRIAEDQLDILVELGGTTHMNKLEVMAFRPAAHQASWLGYPHSAGLTSIDYLLVDPFLNPERPDYMIEKPLMLPHAWYALGSLAFREEPQAAAQSPFERNGHVTFGTANQTYKYSPAHIATWAQVLKRVPGSRFMFVRPEGTSATFVENIARLFEAEGVGRDRLRFEAVRGRHLPFYNEMDISLDAAPQTGGTTTCESLWMGVPVVTLVGPTVFERLSYSVLMNLGLEELCTRTPEAFVDAAVALAEDRPRLNELRRTLRPRMKASPLGQIEAFAHDFYEAMAAAVTGQAG